MANVVKYSDPDASRLFQGDILSGLREICLPRAIPGEFYSDGRVENIEYHVLTHPLTVVIAQDCDLEQDAQRWPDLKGKPDAQRPLPNILLCDVFFQSELRRTSGYASDLWKRVKSNSDERFHVIEKLPVDAVLEGDLDEYLAIDFKRYFTTQTEALYQLIEDGHVVKRCRLVTPYCEQLCQRFANYLARIPIPVPHDTK